MLFQLLAILPLVLCLFEDIPVIQKLSIEEIKKQVENPDFTVVSIIYDESGNKSWQLSRLLIDLTSKFSNYVKFYAYDCSNDPTVCDPSILSELPAIQLYVPAGINPYTGKPLVNERNYQGNLSGKALGEFIMDNIPYLGDHLYSENDEFWKESQNKTILFTNKDSEPIIYKGISSKFRGRLEVGLVWSNNTKLTTKYNITEYPSLIVLQNETIHTYSGKYDFKDISIFLKPFISDSKKPLKAKKISATEESDLILPEFRVMELNKDNFQENIKETPGVVLVHFHKEKHFNEWEDMKKAYLGAIKLGEISCKSKADLEFCASQGVKKYPSVRVYPLNKSRKSFDLVFDTISDLEGILSKELKPDIQILQQAGLSAFINSVENEQKVSCLYISDNPMPLTIKGLASEAHFKDFAKFFYVNLPQSEASKYFNLNRYPALFSLIKANAKEKISVFLTLYDDLCIPWSFLIFNSGGK